MREFFEDEEPSFSFADFQQWLSGQKRKKKTNKEELKKIFKDNIKSRVKKKNLKDDSLENE